MTRIDYRWLENIFWLAMKFQGISVLRFRISMPDYAGLWHLSCFALGLHVPALHCCGSAQVQQAEAFPAEEDPLLAL